MEKMKIIAVILFVVALIWAICSTPFISLCIIVTAFIGALFIGTIGEK